MDCSPKELSSTDEDLTRYIIVNADDFGYFNFVSRGIITCAEAGVVTATGIFANSPHVKEHILWLKQCDKLDAGVHLNLTDRAPLFSGLKNKLAKWNGCFPDKFTMARLILSGKLNSNDLTQEFRAQIEFCLSQGVSLSFLNSHEHIHMLPTVFKLTQRLAIEYGIPHVRYSSPDKANWSVFFDGFVRDYSLRALDALNRNLVKSPVIPFLGMAASGKLNLPYLRRIFNNLSPGVYELMCHPGAHNIDEDVTDSDLLTYHDWNEEFTTLTSDEFKSLCAEESICLIGYRHLSIEDGVFKVQLAHADS